MVFALDVLFYYGLNKRINCACPLSLPCFIVWIACIVAAAFFLLILRQGCMLFFLLLVYYYEEP